MASQSSAPSGAEVGDARLCLARPNAASPGVSASHDAEVGDGSLRLPRLIARRCPNNEDQCGFVHICGNWKRQMNGFAHIWRNCFEEQ